MHDEQTMTAADAEGTVESPAVQEVENAETLDVLSMLTELAPHMGGEIAFADFVSNVHQAIGDAPSETTLKLAATVVNANTIDIDKRTILLSILYDQYGRYAELQGINFLEDVSVNVANWHPAARLQLFSRMVQLHDQQRLAPLPNLALIVRAVHAAATELWELKADNTDKEVADALAILANLKSVPDRVRARLLDLRDDYCAKHGHQLSLSALRRRLVRESAALANQAAPHEEMARAIIDGLDLKTQVGSQATLAYVACLLKLETSISLSRAQSLLTT